MAKIGKRVYGPYTTATWATISTLVPRNDGFIADVDGLLVFTPKGNVLGAAPTGTFSWVDAEVTIPVKGGVLTPIEAGKLNLASCTTMTTIWLVAGESR